MQGVAGWLAEEPESLRPVLLQLMRLRDKLLHFTQETEYKEREKKKKLQIKPLLTEHDGKKSTFFHNVAIK